jgi:hypothetical protein
MDILTPILPFQRQPPLWKDLQNRRDEAFARFKRKSFQAR